MCNRFCACGIEYNFYCIPIAHTLSIFGLPSMCISFWQFACRCCNDLSSTQFFTIQSKFCRYCCMFHARLFAPCRTFMLCINSLHRHIDYTWYSLRQIELITMIFTHITVQKVTTTTISICMCTQYIIATRSRTHAQCVCQIARCCLCITAIAPIYQEYTITIYQRRLLWCYWCCIYRSSHLSYSRRE